MNAKCVVAAAGLAVAGMCSSVYAQPEVDGVLDNEYTLLALQTCGTGFGDSGEIDCDPDDTGNPGDVVTGIEFSIPLAELGFPAGAIRLFAAINGGGHDFVSNQILGSLPLGTGNLGEPRSIDFGFLDGTQHVEFTPTTGAAPTIDGVLDASYVQLALQGNQTGFGDNNDPSVPTANGSELDGAYAVHADGFLYVFLTGNLESNFNKLEVFFDSESGGQNKLRGDNPNVDFDGLNRMGDDGSDNGMTFDAGFTADYWLSCTLGGDPTTIYANFASLNFGYGDYLGNTTPGSDGELMGGNNVYGISLTIDNSNVEGVPGLCNPSGTRDFANGSELDGLYSYVDLDNNRLYIMLTGNLQNGLGAKESNSGNKVTVFLDVQDGGQARLRGDNVDISYGNLNRMGDDGSGNGFAFDAGFEADYWMSMKTNDFPVHQIMDAAVLRTDGAKRDFSGNSLDYGAYDWNAKDDLVPIPFDGPLLQLQDGFTPNIYCNYGPRTTEMDPNNPVVGLLGYYIDNSNTGGVTDSDVSDAGNVTTGLEICIDLDEAGWDGVSPMRVAAMLSNEDASYLSNQFLPGIPFGSANVGNDGPTASIDMANYAGTQWAEIPVGTDPCDYADFNNDNVVNTQDFIAFLGAWSGQNTSADCNGDTVINTQDFICFLGQWSACR